MSYFLIKLYEGGLIHSMPDYKVMYSIQNSYPVLYKTKHIDIVQIVQCSREYMNTVYVHSCTVQFLANMVFVSYIQLLEKEKCTLWIINSSC